MLGNSGEGQGELTTLDYTSSTTTCLLSIRIRLFGVAHQWGAEWALKPAILRG